MLFETLTSSNAFFDGRSIMKNPLNNIFKKQDECYPDDWCRPQSGSGCCPGPEDCYPSKCTPERDGDCNPKACYPDK